MARWTSSSSPSAAPPPSSSPARAAGAAVAPLLAGLGFHVTVCDSRDDAADPARFPPASDNLRVLCADHDDPAVTAHIADPSAAAFLVMTHDHQLDQTAIEHALSRGFGFVGGVGSRAKAARTRARLEAKGFPPAEIARVRMPLGLEIGARTPAEIAVAVAAELVSLRAGAAPPAHLGPPVAAGHAGPPSSLPAAPPAHLGPPVAAGHAGPHSAPTPTPLPAEGPSDA
ncbi:MAG: XdhC family protein [Polyangiaceae bacterium]